MIKKITFLIFLSFHISKGQEKNTSIFSINPEILLGVSGTPNTNFPDRRLQKQVFLNFGWHHSIHRQKWLSFLKTRKAGVSLGYTDLGNQHKLGDVFTIQTFLEFNAFRSEDINIHLGIGTSYFTEKYHSITNEFNKAVSTNLTWSFRMFMFYNLIKSNQFNWRVGVGYTHHSNGHTSFPNQGYNSFLLSVGTEIKTTKEAVSDTIFVHKPKKFNSKYYSIRSGLGVHVLSEAFDEMKNVYIVSGEYGKIYNNTFKLGFGAYFRFYESYYDYILNNESLVQEGREFSDLKSNPFMNSLNVGITANTEFLLNHFGIDIQIGVNLFKPAYKIDARINQGWGFVPRTIPEEGGYFRLGDLSETYYTLKYRFSGRLGLKYYFIGTSEKPIHNFFVGAFINSNLGQADFTEIAIGYTKQLTARSK
jgi:hypothetical protein